MVSYHEVCGECFVHIRQWYGYLITKCVGSALFVLSLISTKGKIRLVSGFCNISSVGSIPFQSQ